MSNYLGKIVCSILLLVLLGCLFFFERKGLSYSETGTSEAAILEQNNYTTDIEPTIECLLVYNSDDKVSNMYKQIMEYLLQSLSVGFDTVDLNIEKLPVLDAYSTVVLSISDFTVLKEDVFTLKQWVFNGGGLMNAYSYQISKYFELIYPTMGIINTNGDYTTVSDLYVDDGFMIGGGRSYHIGESQTAMKVLLEDSCKVHLWDELSHTPILWEKNYGDGKYVVINIEDYSKTNRGLLTAAYSLLQDVFIYPVINGSVFYIDDFPCDVPEEDNEYITKDYQMSVRDFYRNVWWPTIMEWEEVYGIIHTGMIIETYNDIVEEPFLRQKDDWDFTFFGNMLLRQKGEIGIHGYNHMPLCLKGYDFMGEYDYIQWPDENNMKLGLEELFSFTRQLYPGLKPSVYVPPSNVLSKEGRAMLVREFPDIRVIASSYLPLDGSCEYIQEFDVGEDGIINTPRITAGCNIDDYMELAAFSELNIHYVQSHFLHADDALDKERGAELGWVKLSDIFERYLSWIYTSAPNLRNLTGSQMGEAVEIYDTLSIQRSFQDQGLSLKLGGFSKEAYLMLRLNNGEEFTLTGGTYEHITGNIYLIRATSDQLQITWK